MNGRASKLIRAYSRLMPGASAVFSVGIPPWVLKRYVKTLNWKARTKLYALLRKEIDDAR